MPKKENCSILIWQVVQVLLSFYVKVNIINNAVLLCSGSLLLRAGYISLGATTVAFYNDALYKGTFDSLKIEIGIEIGIEKK